MSASDADSRKRFFLPLAILLALVGALAYGLMHVSRDIQSPLIGKSAPAFRLPVLGDTAIYTDGNLKGHPRLVNFFASWCAACQDEHPVLMKLAREQNVEIVGMDYKDTTADITAWLAKHGNPYRTVVMDEQGTAGLDWGVYGVPETYAINAQGVIVYKHIGAMTEAVWRSKIAPLLAGVSP
jgi:cytochrome c biogenesis protein CcmG/thiol:disulfide interchange protein DsbE